jgi:predicted nucleic acid-binding protein
MSGFLLDTSFLITLVNPDRDHHEVAKAYYREALQRGVPLVLSTIVLSEFQVGQTVDSLPLHNFIVLPFNYDHAVQAGLLFRWLRSEGPDWQGQRGAVKDDLKLIAQAECNAIPMVLTADEQTLCRYARRLADAGQARVLAITLAAGFDMAWFNDGQGALPGT